MLPGRRGIVDTRKNPHCKKCGCTLVADLGSNPVVFSCENQLCEDNRTGVSRYDLARRYVEGKENKGDAV